MEGDMVLLGACVSLPGQLLTSGPHDVTTAVEVVDWVTSGAYVAVAAAAKRPAAAIE